MTNFYCLKWGTKYSYEYVNRLFYSLKKYYQEPFNFHCLTDIKTDLHTDIIVHPLPKTFYDYPQPQIFTREKLCYFNDFKHVSGKKAWFDLDILIHNDITKLIHMNHLKPRFIFNYWRDPLAHIKNYGYMTTPLNSSFVAWQDDVGYSIYESLIKTKDKAFFTYPSLDKYLFYQHYRKNTINTWPKGIAYNYNIGAHYPHNLNPTKFQSTYKLCLFNTSHKQWAKKGETHIELHDAEGWPKILWESYDKK